MGFGLLPAGFACALASPSARGARGWLFGAAMSLLGALGVFGLQNGAALLIAWELMSLGGAVMIVGENLEPSRGRTVLFMLALLEVGAVALVLAIAILGVRISSLQLSDFNDAAVGLSQPAQVGMGLLFLIGFGAKLGLLPFYEWFPGAYGSGSGASGAIMSGVVLNAAFFGLSRALFNWLPAAPDGAFPALAMIVIVVATLSAILTILYAFQQDDWRCSAELLIRRERLDRRRRARRRADLPDISSQRSGRSRLDRRAPTSGRPRARQRDALPHCGRA